MKDRVEAPKESRPAVERAPARAAGSVAAQALALQRSAGNRVARQVLSRWIKHPDKQKKGVMVPDSVAAEYDHFNPPKNE
jgi:hypothetical protein